MTEQLFVSVTSSCLAEKFLNAKQFVCYAAPGIQTEPANSLVELAKTIGPENIAVHLDFDSHVFRMGFGRPEAVEALRSARIEVHNTPGLRVGLAIVDVEGYIFTPTALFVEDEVQSNSAPNAMRLTENQITDVLARFSEKTKAVAQKFAPSDSAREQISKQITEVQFKPVGNSEYTAMKEQLAAAPPVEFDLARRVHVFNSYLQYVELKLTGAAIQRHKIRIPQRILKIGGGNDELMKRLHTTFDLIERDSDLSSKEIENELNEIRQHFTRSLGNIHGRVLLKSQKKNFQSRLEGLEVKLTKYKEKMKSELERELDKSLQLVIEHYLPLVTANPPDSLLGAVVSGKAPTDDEKRLWLKGELGKEFLGAEKFTEKMQLHVKYMDITFEILNQDGFFESVKKAYPTIDFGKLYEQFTTAPKKIS